MPGFVDAHGHFPGSGQTAFSVDLNSPPIGDTASIPQLLEKLRAFGLERDDGWLIGSGYDDTLLAERRHPTRFDLDQVSATRPIGIVHVSGHLMVVNTAALEALGIDETTPDPEGGILFAIRILRTNASPTVSLKKPPPIRRAIKHWICRFQTRGT